MRSWQSEGQYLAWLRVRKEGAVPCPEKVAAWVRPPTTGVSIDAGPASAAMGGVLVCAAHGL